MAKYGRYINTSVTDEFNDKILNYCSTYGIPRAKVMRDILTIYFDEYEKKSLDNFYKSKIEIIKINPVNKVELEKIDYNNLFDEVVLEKIDYNNLFDIGKIVDIKNIKNEEI